MTEFSFAYRLLPLALLAVPAAHADGYGFETAPATIEARMSAARAAGIAAGQAAYAPYRKPIEDAWQNPSEVAALTAIAYAKSSAATIYATCRVIAVHPDTCLLRQFSIQGASK